MTHFFSNASPRKIALSLLALALLKALILALIITPSYGADGAGYLGYMQTFKDLSTPDGAWYIRGTTPVYPFFAYSAYLFGLGSGYTIALAQIVLGALVAPALYAALRPFDERAALVAGLLLAFDPQMGLLNQLVATDGVYGAMLALGMAAFFWQVRYSTSLKGALGLGLLLGVCSFVRPIGIFLIVPYLFFYFGLTRSLKRSTLLALGYVSVALLLSLINLWRFDFFAPNNTNGFYLGTRLFGIGGLYDRSNGEASERLFTMAELCGVHLTDQADAETLSVSQNLRLCLVYEFQLSLDQISRLYQDAYAEATRTKPTAYVTSVIRQMISYTAAPSDAYDLEGAKQLTAKCQNAPTSDAWFEREAMFCPALPTPLAFLGKIAFAGMLGFNAFTHIPNFVLVALIFWRSKTTIRWLLLFCVGFYAYHAAATAAAGTILSRYVTINNSYLLVALGFALIGLYDWWQDWRGVVVSAQPQP